VLYERVSLAHQDLGRRRTETAHQQRVSHAVIERAVGEWRQRVLAGIRAGGGHFE